MMARREVLRSFSLSETETSVERNLQRAHAHHNSLMRQWVAAEDAPEMCYVGQYVVKSLKFLFFI